MEIKVYHSLVWILVLLPVCLSYSPYKTCGVKSTTATTLMLLLFMLSYLTCALTPTTDGAISFLKCGDLKTENPYAFIGEKFVLTCAIWNVDDNKTVSLYFDTPVNKNGSWSSVEINQTGYEIMQLNSTAIQLISPVLTVEDAQWHNKFRRYRCMVREVVNNCTAESKKHVNNTFVEIDYYPHHPENFSCQVYNWDRLTCTWDMIPYFQKDDIRVECFWKNDAEYEDSQTTSLWSSCPNVTFTSFTMYDFIMMPDYWFYFNIINFVRHVVNTSRDFHISPSQIVQPAPVDTISFQNLSDTCVTVVWNHSKQFRDKVFRVRYTSECSSEQQITTREMKVTVCDLNPYTYYTFFVDSRPLVQHMKGNGSLDTIGFTSDPRNISFTTISAVPAANPKLLSYSDEPCFESPCRKVLVYWEPLSPCDLHDNLSGKHYEITINQRGSMETWKTIADSEKVSQLFMLPDEDKVYDVMLRVITGTGKKQEDFSQMVIWPRKQSPIAPSMVVEYDMMENGTNFYITLNLTKAQSQTFQILYWCHGLRGSGCQKAMSFMEINGSSTKIFIGNYMMDFNIKFGVESKQLLSGEITRSGIQMGICIYRKDQKPRIPPRNFHIAKGISEREGELSLQWDPYDCNSPNIESGYVLSYTLYYCQVTSEAFCNLLHWTPVSVEQHIHNYIITKLKPGGRYKVWLTATTSAGEGPPTDAIDTRTYKEEFPLWGMIMIGVGCIIILVVITICFVKFQKYIKGRREAYSRIEVPDTRIQLDEYVEIPISNGHVHRETGHVIVDDQSAEPIPDMDESEELGKITPLIPNGDAKVSNDHKGYGSYISNNDVNSASSDTESERETLDEKEIMPVAFVLSAEPGHQNADLLPEDYCRAVGNGDYVPNGKTNPSVYEDMCDNKFFMLQGQAVHSQSIGSLLNDGTELQELNCKGNICERDKGVDPVSEKDPSNLPQENISIEKQIESGWMKSRDDSESDELALSGDDFDDAASDDSSSLLGKLCRSLDKKDKTSGYVPANEVDDEDGEPLLSGTYLSFDANSHIDEFSLGSDDDDIRYEPDSIRSDINHVSSEMDSVRSENNHVRSEIESVRSEKDHVTSDTDEIIRVDFVTCDNNNDVRCDEYTVRTNDNGVRSVDEHGRSDDNCENSCVDSGRTCVVPGTFYDNNPELQDRDPTVIKHHLNIVQNGIPDDQEKEKEDMDTFLRLSENNGPDINEFSAMQVVPNGVQNGLVKIPYDMMLVKKVGMDGTSRNGYTRFPTACTHVNEENEKDTIEMLVATPK